jgi:hypothetical protein
LGWLVRFLASSQGLLTIGASVTAGLAVGLLPDLVQAVPGVGEGGWWVAAGAVVAGVVCAVCATLLHGKEGVGIVLVVGEDGWDVTRLEAMRRNALERHAGCFTVNVSELLGEDDREVRDRVRFAHRVMQARLTEGGQSHEDASLYVTARHPDAYYLGGLLRDQRQARLSLMMRSRRAGVGIVEALRLHSDLADPPSPSQKELLREVLVRDPVTEGPEWVPFEQPEGVTARRIALVLPLAGHIAGTREKALAAARDGRHPEYRFPRQNSPADIDRNRCAGALVFATRPGDVPDRREVYEALVRYVNEEWQRKMAEVLEEQGDPLRGWLFTDGPVEVVLALGNLLGRQTDLVPHQQPAREGAGARGAR